MPVVGRGDDDGIDILVLEDLAVVERAFALETFLRDRDALLIDVAGAHDLAGVGLDLLGVTLEALGDVKSAAARADDGDVDAVVGADDARGIQLAGGLRHRRGGEGNGGAGHEGAAMSLIVNHGMKPPCPGKFSFILSAMSPPAQRL